MKEIVCPKCNTPFKVDEDIYESIVAQVRNSTFNEEIEKRMNEAREQFKSKEENIRLLVERTFEEKLADNVARIKDLDKEIVRLNGLLDAYDATKKSEISELVARKSKELFQAISDKDKELAEARSRNESEIARLKARIAEKDSELAIKILEEKNAGQQLIQKKEQEITELRAEIKAGKLSADNREAQLREQHKLELQYKQEEIDRLKDMRLRLSTKMVGETLEQHCYNLFIDMQTRGLYRSAELVKDNIAIDHSKGDFIFRDYIDGTPYISIMFEMKNEMDTTAAKHKNSDFLDKLDKDRTRKNCEYAILVSMLEQDNEMYNRGIVDMSHLYPKMLVIRPQFFMTIIQILSDAAKRSYTDNQALVRELETVRSQRLDFTKFETRLNNFRDKFNKNVMAAHKKFTEATDGIDKAIEGLEKQIQTLRKIKASFEASEQKLLKANEVADEDLTVRKLTHGIKSVREMIETQYHKDE